MVDWTDDSIGVSWEAMRGTLIGPMIPSAYLDDRISEDRDYGASLLKQKSEECMEWLETKPVQSVVFISFGSFGILFEKQLTEIAIALQESNLNFLWVIREAHIKKLPEGFVESTKDRALLVSWCNQLEVLAHESIGCFLTHCGWNSTLEGLRLGVPMVGVPQWSDQMNDAKFVEDVWKVGYRAKEDACEGIVKSEEVVRCLKGVMEGESSVNIRESSKKWKDLAVKAMSEGGSSDRSINEFIESLVKKH
ncbi:PREDICTED: UDP-glycosyltransferase 74B1-like [Camelina sativa]|uniref:UDP-glycosyltransferase 74B1-like n=1 Tax=Camelina sativa TaxID=90675 RepID=A0ABM0X5A3_CAMSA|nr:PREDICTED: UDP-glycosyltransferase 74B1-like [Camelina sativa]